MVGTRRIWIWVIVGSMGALALAAAFWIDPVVRNWILEHPNRQVRIGMNQISRFGDWPEHVLLGVLLLAFAWWRGNKKWTRVFLAMLVACAMAGAAARVIKMTTGRARPSVKTELTWTGPRLSEKYHAFPSGHTAASTAFFSVLAIASWRIGAPFLLIPLLIAFSRMYVAAHYLSDVAFALILGILSAIAVTRIAKIRNIRGNGSNYN